MGIVPDFEPYFESDQCVLYCGDSRDPDLATHIASAHQPAHCITDPPWNVSRDASQNISYKLHNGQRSHKRRDYDNGEAWDTGYTVADLLQPLAAILPAGGNVLAFCGDTLLSYYLTYQHELPENERSFLARSSALWIKSNPVPAFRRGYQKSVEFIAWLHRAGAPIVFNGNGATVNTFFYPQTGSSERTKREDGKSYLIAQKPLDLMCELIRLHSNAGETIYDPFAGTGSTLVAAALINRKAVGVEINPQHCELITRRLQKPDGKIQHYTPAKTEETSALFFGQQ
jgi:DNA modification methylase